MRVCFFPDLYTLHCIENSFSQPETSYKKPTEKSIEKLGFIFGFSVSTISRSKMETTTKKKRRRSPRYIPYRVKVVLMEPYRIKIQWIRAIAFIHTRCFWSMSLFYSFLVNSFYCSLRITLGNCFTKKVYKTFRCFNLLVVMFWIREERLEL